MNASEAQKATEAGKRRIAKERIDAAKEKERQAAERLEWAKKEFLPKYRKEIRRIIAAAAEDGKVIANYTISWSKEPELATIICDELTKDGYEAKWNIRHWDGDDGYPAGSSTDFEFFWGKEHERPRPHNSYWR